MTKAMTIKHIEQWGLLTIPPLWVSLFGTFPFISLFGMISLGSVKFRDVLLLVDTTTVYNAIKATYVSVMC